MVDVYPASEQAEVFMTTFRTYVITGTASGIGRATRQLLESQGHRVIGADLRDAEIIADLSTVEGRQTLIAQATQLSEGMVT
jgi:NAD(P)-dependent dehydrogenase (short-subunit alcohol dehydrogenase family)